LQKTPNAQHRGGFGVFVLIYRQLTKKNISKGRNFKSLALVSKNIALTEGLFVLLI
jgi:hypothetical protein